MEAEVNAKLLILTITVTVTVTVTITVNYYFAPMLIVQSKRFPYFLTQS